MKLIPNIDPLSSLLYYNGMNRGPCDFINRYKFIIIAYYSLYHHYSCLRLLVNKLVLLKLLDTFESNLLNKFKQGNK